MSTNRISSLVEMTHQAGDAFIDAIPAMHAAMMYPQSMRRGPGDDVAA